MKSKLSSTFFVLSFAAFCTNCVSSAPAPARSLSSLPSDLQIQVARFSATSASRGRALQELGQLDLSDSRRMRVDDGGAVFVVEDSAPVIRRRSSSDTIRMRRMFSGTSPTSFINGVSK
jgi:hypothetical protein